MAELLPFLLLLLLYSLYSTYLSGTAAQPQPPEFLGYICSNAFNYTPNSTYQKNLNSLLSSLPYTTAANYGFSNTSAGRGPNTVNAIALSRGDVSRDVCISCLSNATIKLRQDCPYQMEAIGWYDLCMLRYSNVNISDRVDDLFGLSLPNPNNVTTNVAEFSAAIRNLTDRLRVEAAAGGSLRKFATGDTMGTDLLKLYALMQCTPDLSPSDCAHCLDTITRTIPSCCNGRRGGRVSMPSCNLRFEVYRFYDRIPSIPLPPPPPPSQLPPLPPLSQSAAGKSKNTALIVVLVAVVTLVIVVLVALVCRFMKMWKKRRVVVRHEPESTFHENGSQFPFSTIRSATDDFSESNKLGQGGFGVVYKGRLPNGQLIAVKRLSKTSNQGEEEFKNEMVLVSGLQHRNLVRLLGFCLEGTEKLLIYEFVPNGSLDQILFDPAKRRTLDWDKRYKIIVGIARGLLYLHEDLQTFQIIHHDLKASNVLLDVKMNAKIADFGLARLFKPEETLARTERISGTYGYMAPEYALNGLISVKMDVYSFGVLLLEILSGRRNNVQNGDTMEDLPGDAWKSWGDGAISRVIDPILTAAGPSGSMPDMRRFIQIALLCVQEKAADRPNMQSVVLMLSSSSVTLRVPSNPPLFISSGLIPEASGYNSRAHWSVNDISAIYPR